MLKLGIQAISTESIPAITLARSGSFSHALQTDTEFDKSMSTGPLIPNKTVSINLLLWLLVLSVHICVPPSAMASETRLALVLGGGGARGGAHIGVLKQLDSLGIVPDIVVGTSIGSLIGGLYAAGNSGAEVESIITGVELENLFQQISPRQSRSFRRKKDDSDLLVKLRLRIENGKLLFPDGLVSTHPFRLWLAEQFKDFVSGGEFDELDVKFATVSTDLANGEKLVLNQGSIEESIYASMSVPGLMKPIEKAGQLLVDGGLVDNLPISVAKQLGATHIIAVDVGTPFYKLEQINSSVRSLDQMARLQTRGNTERSIAVAQKDKNILLISPELDGISTAAFKDIELAIAEGERTANLMYHEIEQYKGLSERGDREIRLPKPSNTELLKVRSLEFTTNAALSRKYLSAHFETREGDYFNRNLIGEDIQRLYGTGLFNRIQYTTSNISETGVDVKVSALEERGRSFVQFGLTLDEDFKNVSEFGLNFAHTKTQLNSSGTALHTQLSINSDPSISTELYQPFGKHLQYFTSMTGTYSRPDIRDAGALKAERLNAYSLQWGLGRYFSNWGSVSIDRLLGRASINGETLKLTVSELKLERDTLDDPAFPTIGTRFTLASRWTRLQFGSFDTTSEQTSLDAAKFISSGRNTLALWGTYAVGGDSVLNENPLEVGGFLNLSGFERNGLEKNEIAIARTMFYRRLSKSELTNVFSVPLYAGSSLEYGRLYEKTASKTISENIFAGSVFVGANSVIGPLLLGVGVADTGESRIYLSLGRPFVYELTSTDLDF